MSNLNARKTIFFSFFPFAKNRTKDDSLTLYIRAEAYKLMLNNIHSVSCDINFIDLLKVVHREVTLLSWKKIIIIF